MYSKLLSGISRLVIKELRIDVCTKKRMCSKEKKKRKERNSREERRVTDIENVFLKFHRTPTFVFRAYTRCLRRCYTLELRLLKINNKSNYIDGRERSN